MAEAIALGSSEVASIGLASQVLQGCQYVKTLLGDFKDAYNDMRSLEAEISMLMRILDGCKTNLTEIARLDGNDASVGCGKAGT